MEKSLVDKEKLDEIVRQLRCPNGKDGITMGELLSNTNKGMITESILSLQLCHKNRVLELGHGNCEHLCHVLEQATQLKYFGMEISSTMKCEAERINHQFIQKKQALFQLYNGSEIPYVHNFFDRIVTVNTIYFWENPIVVLKELYRVLKPDGICIITYAKKTFMKELSFVAQTNVFDLYDNQRLKEFVRETKFELRGFKDKTERVKSKSGKWVKRPYSIVILKKQMNPKTTLK